MQHESIFIKGHNLETNEAPEIHIETLISSQIV